MPGSCGSTCPHHFCVSLRPIQIQKNLQHQFSSQNYTSNYNRSMHVKVTVAGPKGTGKTLISNFLAGQSDKLTSENYNPTMGVRILEFESTVRGLQENVNVELWDSAGDHSYENCWKAVMNESDGVILIYNPDAPSQDQQLNDWFEYFVKKNGLKDEQCLIFAHKSGTTNPSAERFRPPPLFSKVSAGLTTPNSEADIKTLFENFLKELVTMKSKQNQRK